jgi:hypothetical protein
MKIRALAVLVPLLALSACTEDNNVSIQVARLCAPPDDGCSFQSTCDAQYIGVNVLDLSVTDAFWSFIEVHNQIENNEDVSAGRPNTHDAHVEEYEVEYSVTGGTALPSVRRRIEAGPTFIEAEGSAVVSVFPIPPEIAALLVPGSQVVARVRLHGFLDDQSDWETAEFPIPIETCSGCLGVPVCAGTLSACPQLGQSPASITCE